MLRRALAALFLCWLVTLAGAAEVGPRRALLSGAGCPASVAVNRSCPTFSLNFASGNAWRNGSGFVAFTSLLTATRAGANATNLLPSSPSGFAYTTYGANTLRLDSTGLLDEVSRVNQLFNSTAPATQTTPSLATGTYTLWVNGSGSAQMSLGTGVGCGTGTATQGNPVSFTISVTGTCIVTVVGSLNAFQLELGAFGTSLIITAGATGTRANDDYRATGALLTLLGSSALSVLATTKTITTQGASYLIGFGANTGWLYLNFGQGTLRSANGTVALNDGAVASFIGTNKAWLGFDGTGRSFVTNNGTIATDANPWGVSITTGYIGSNGASNSFLNGYWTSLNFWNYRQSDAVGKVQTL